MIVDTGQIEKFITIYPDLSNYNKLVKELYSNGKMECVLLQ